MSGKADWALYVLTGLAKVFVVMTTAEIFAYLFHEHYNVAYATGLLFGIALQHAIPPRARWRREAMILVPTVAVIGIIHAYLHRG
jgi:hypothetical protein